MEIDSGWAIRLRWANIALGWHNKEGSKSSIHQVPTAEPGPACILLGLKYHKYDLHQDFILAFNRNTAENTHVAGCQPRKPQVTSIPGLSFSAGNAHCLWESDSG